MLRWRCGRIAAACATGCRAPAARSNDLLIVGYDREPDTMNRYATHILEDIQSCVIEGLVTNDEKMNIVPVLAAEVPTLENGGVKLRPDGGMDVTWKLRPGVKWHDGVPHTSADVKFTVDAINKGDWKPESTDGFDRIAVVDTPDSLTAIVHYKEVYAPYEMQFFRGTLPKHVLDGPRHRQGQRLQPHSARHRPVSRRRVEDGRVRPARERVPDYWRGPSIRRSIAFCSAFSATRRRASISSRRAKCTSSRSCRGTRCASCDRCPRCASTRCSATATSTSR